MHRVAIVLRRTPPSPNVLGLACRTSVASSPTVGSPKRRLHGRAFRLTGVSTGLTQGKTGMDISLSSGRNILLRFATSTTPHSTPVDPAETEALQCLEKGTQKLEEGDVEGAKALYQRSVEIKRDAGALFNLGVTHYHLKEFDQAILAWKDSIELQPSSPDAHTNLASAYIISPVSRPDLALHHLNTAATLSPEDPEIAFNLAAVLEACGRLEEALTQYKRSKDFGVERAAMHIRNVSAKILGQKMKDT